MKLTAFLFAFLSLIVLGYAQQGNPSYISIDYQRPAEYVIADIKVEGINYLDKQGLLSLSGLKNGDKITIPGDAISNAIKKLWKQKLVGDVKIEVEKTVNDKVYLVIRIKERPRLSDYIITGVKKSDKGDLENKIGFIQGQVLSNALKKNAVFSIEEFFEEEGYFNTKVKVSERVDSTIKNHVVVTFDVDKGERVKINRIKVNGNILITEKGIKKQLKETKEKRLYRFWKRSKYVKEEYKIDKEALISYYNSLGFRDAQILKDSIYVVPNSKNKLINIDLTIEEGHKYYFRNIAWAGNYIYNDKKLAKILGIKKGDIYNKALLDSRLNFNPEGPDVSSLYLDNGYLFFNVNPIELRVEGDSIDLEMRVYEGNIATINDVRVFGNTKTNDHVLLREIRTLPGQEFSRANLIRTQREIAQLGYFDPEQIGIIPIPNPATGTVDIEYRVVEKPSDQLQLSGGWGGLQGFVGTLGLVFNNFSLRNISKPKTWDPLPSGDGQRFSLSIQANGLRFQSYNLSFTEPWLGGKKPNSLTVSLNHSRINNIVDFTTFETDGGLRTTGATVSLGRRLKWPDDWFTMTHSISYTNYDIDNYGFAANICDQCNTNNLAFNTTISRNDIGTNPQFPTQGSSISLSASFTPPYSAFSSSVLDKEGTDRYQWLEYHKWMFDFSHFIKLTGNKRRSTDIFSQDRKQERPFVLNTRAHFGAVGIYNSQLGAPPFERFKLGGSGLSGLGGSNWITGTDLIALRGYEPGQNDTGIAGANNELGILYNKFVAELRFPIVTQGVATIFLLGFAEAGNTWDNYRDYNPFELKRSYGAGIRIFMPAFGMIGIDYGIGIDEIPGQPNMNGGHFHFTIGQQLR
ncbi:MAG: outer membrane protein assembly factor BamA [Cytophagales bacterium]|nr:outer membrane protein assembly factor BamA [Cytophagales bacterium]